MKNVLLVVLVCVFGVFTSCNNDPHTEKIAIIPAPASYYPGEGHFTVQNSMVVSYPSENTLLQQAAIDFCELFTLATGLKTEIKEDQIDADIVLVPLDTDTRSIATGGPGGRSDVIFRTDRDVYRLNVMPEQIIIVASTQPGVVYALQSLLQLMPSTVFAKNNETKQPGGYSIPCVEINDAPSFSWRGAHLDVSRHFFPIEFLYRFVDILSMHKMNIFHLHLTDDQGWRLEIEKYPLLTEKAAWRVDRTNQLWSERENAKEGEKATYGGYYTKKQIKDLVAYAQKRAVTIVPEIEMPGHSSEVFAAYPKLSCTGKLQTVIPGGIYPKDNVSSLCAGNEEVFVFLEGVLSEVIELFPSPYIHIGGDEASKEHWKQCPKCQERMRKEGLSNEDELQSYFIKRIGRYLRSKGRRLLGWDEILEGGLAPGAVVMSWRGTEGGIAAAKKGHRVVMTPGTHLYFDHYQDTPKNEPVSIGGFSTVRKVYEFNPIPAALNKDEARNILGAQANLWTEYITTPQHAEYMLLPRLCALSEVVWSPRKIHNWSDFQQRLYVNHLPRLSAMGLNNHPGAGNVQFTGKFDEASKAYFITMESEVYGTDVYYTIDGSEPGINAIKYQTPIKINNPTLIKAVVVRDGKVFSKSISEKLAGNHKGLGKPVRYNTSYSMQYKGAGGRTLNDGMTGSMDVNDGLIQGVANKDMDVVFDLGESVSFQKVTGSFLQSIGAWIYLPIGMSVWVSDDGSQFTKASCVVSEPDYKTQVLRKTIEVAVDTPIQARYIRITADNPVTPEGLPGAGSKNWIFVDEIFIE